MAVVAENDDFVAARDFEVDVVGDDFFSVTDGEMLNAENAARFGDDLRKRDASGGEFIVDADGVEFGDGLEFGLGLFGFAGFVAETVDEFLEMFFLGDDFFVGVGGVGGLLFFES